ncbi:hypothetical protein, conserved [Entamoeba dispar SAW760]|uniref:Uncharacterized protein n=1 Tax=Entamoeba dispar (strain ATCC PRA-260 / SAW760) TaxID=370354 RepID=B0ESL8_ENTDS|nr:uncharacterized protein EDI_204440 [Entamoeba dispar SAW760]EDR22512.1 hypothetical protein, conserved [Entamoeba dispar SAW760]|eukprot:EDR22512.1 hypothetical protein, conserved [Entamoeba dispar SAW760]
MKVVMVGDCGVGKTSIVNRLVNNEFNKETSPTVAAVFRQTIVDNEDDSYKLEIWDTAGEEKYRSVVGSYFRGANGAVIVFDVIDKNSFEHIFDWEFEIKQIAPEATILILGNKAEQNKWMLQKDEIEIKLKQNRLNYFFVSAKTGLNIKKAFISLATTMQPSEINENVCVLNSNTKVEEGCC